MQALRTGDVVQIRNYGRNYIVLGKALDQNGSPVVVMTKNGNILNDGSSRQITVRNPITGRRVRCEARIFHCYPEEIRRVHGSRYVNMEDVKERLAPRQGLASYLVPTNAGSGLRISAPSVHQLGGDLIDLTKITRRSN